MDNYRPSLIAVSYQRGVWVSHLSTTSSDNSTNHITFSELTQSVVSINSYIFWLTGPIFKKNLKVKSSLVYFQQVTSTISDTKHTTQMKTVFMPTHIHTQRKEKKKEERKMMVQMVNKQMCSSRLTQRTRMCWRTWTDTETRETNGHSRTHTQLLKQLFASATESIQRTCSWSTAAIPSHRQSHPFNPLRN